MPKPNSSRSEMLFILGFLFTLIAAFGTFFLGLRMGIDKTEAKYAYLSAAPSEKETSASYAEQDLVTFYYVVFQPYQEFKESYLDLIDDLSSSRSTAESNDELKEIRKLAKQQYEQIAAHSISGSSPLLKEAQTDLLKSLKLFEDGVGNAVSTSGSKKGNEFVQILDQSDFTKNAEEYGLDAQKKYYTSILKWTAKTNSSIPVNYTYPGDATIPQWSGYPLAVKDKAVTDMMVSKKLFASYLPQDLTAKIDNMIKSGKAKELNLHSVSAIVKVLTETEAVKGKEFAKWKSAYYASESLPEVPFFSED